MKKSLFLFLFLTYYYTHAQIVNIPDVNFKNALIGLGLDANLDGEIQVSEAESVTGILDVSSKDINNLTGIEAFINMETLECSYNNLSSVDISNLTGLVEFICHYNNLSSIDVTNNPSLTLIGLNDNDLSEIDLSNNLYLWGFDCAGNHISLLDLSNTGYYFGCFHCDDNDLTFLDMRNGFNENIGCFSASANPNLTCIYVDNSEYSTENWTGIDEASTFVENEAECEALATNEDLLSNEILIFPNPFSNSLDFNLSIDQKFHVDIYNTIGEKVISTDKKHINTSNLNNGLYILKIKLINGKSLTKKLIKVGT